ncbi:gamma-glutamyltransferase [Luteolibacter sp. SL250]|uniref:gamma-glutamyltransferase n=1 Tax=Luteolibacter sp. SL250 TaxID=2995170 RepID=UPI00226F87DD|nr:gamma-glutamyltransferase [Luteolibacter sp. SL250]WAC18114.1 gamma-glutamyltransferase [Luteolibacter sp. SL250]
MFRLSHLAVFAATLLPIHGKEAAVFTKGVVATVHPIATDAAVEIMKSGGNAIDAAVTAGLTLGVVDPSNSGIGGGCFILIRLADGTVHAIDGRETAPAASMPDMYLVDGKADTELSQTGALASGVPGALAAYAHAVAKFGKRPLAEHLAPGIRAARDGYRIGDSEVRKLTRNAENLRKFDGSRKVFLDADGKPHPAGTLLVQGDLAATYQGIADQGPDYFYKGPVAETIGAWMKENGGILTAADFANYSIKLREPIVSTYRSHRLYGFPPASSGGVHVAQILNIVENFNLAGMEESDRIHTIAEAMKLAFADRAHWLGDPDFTKVPKGLADPGYAKSLAQRIDPSRAIPVEKHGLPPEWETNVFGRHTTHFSAADAEGNWVAITATINTTYGSKVIVPGTGVILNNEMDDFSIQPGVPNAFGLIGGDANKVEPGKRPLSAMSPTIVLDPAGNPLLSLGAAGGPTIISQTVLNLISVIDLKLPLTETLARPRFHHQWAPDTLRVERSLPEAVLGKLREKGHKIQAVDSIGVSQIVGKDGGKFGGASDPRVKGKAAKW